MNTGFLGPAVATVLTACGIETNLTFGAYLVLLSKVATVLTACGIETLQNWFISPLNSSSCNSTYRLRY